VLESECHIYYYEVGGMSALGGLIPRLVTGKDGIMKAEDIRSAIRDYNVHYAMPSLICVENTHNRGGGTIYDLERLSQIRAVANEKGLPMHLDGARIFNASVKLGVEASQIAKYFDSIQFCLSKGLSAPVGSILAGDKAFIAKARKYRKMLGGGMRQAGVIAAAGIVALDKMIPRLAEDHENARMLAEGLSKIPGISVDLNTVVTNMVVFDVSALGIGSEAFAKEFWAEGVRVIGRPPHKLRAVTSRMFTRQEVQLTLEKAAKVCSRHI
jgi:threonine aldolase